LKTLWRAKWEFCPAELGYQVLRRRLESSKNGGVRNVFRNRLQAGEQLAELLASLDLEDPLVLALPRGGVPVASPVADRLGCELDVLLVRKIGHPHQPELAIGAIGEGGVTYLNEELVDRLSVPRSAIDEIIARERVELERRAEIYRAGRRPADIRGRDVVIVDDGIATGATVMVAIKVARQAQARTVVVGTPVAPPSVEALLSGFVDQLVAVDMPPNLGSVGQFYRDFSQTSDDEVVALLSARPAQ
jgi:predicted phosphoribosyltransferase